MGIVGIDLIRFEDRLTDVYEGYESICLLTAESKYVPSSHVTVLLTRFNDLFEVILSDIRSLNESYRLSQTDPGFDHPENQNEASWLFLICERQRACKRVASRYWSGERRPCSTSYKNNTTSSKDLNKLL